jgi:alkylation response protein AidB-like acyl-CoA dehydrogenase
MDLDLTPQEEAFRREVRAFVDASLPPAIRDKVLSGRSLEREEVVRWHKILYAQGWAGIGWPKEFGGTGWTPVQQHLFDVECADAGTPRLLPFGVNMVGPVIIAFGSPAQQRRFLPRILSFDDWWCQGYSEPGSGSDLASLKTRAERKGDHYLVNGQKTWTTLAQYADWIFCLVRTASEGRPQEGISFLLIDMKSPGVTVRPIWMLDGEHEINEVWFEDVKVPVENRIGEENKGWTYAKYLLGHERTGIAEVGRSKRELKRLKAMARAQRSGARALFDDARFRDRIAAVEIELMALELTALRVLTAPAGEKKPRPESSFLKIRGSEIRQDISELMMLCVGHDALPDLPDKRPAAHYLNDRKTSIYGGSNEIQKNIVAQMILGL